MATITLVQDDFNRENGALTAPWSATLPDGFDDYSYGSQGTPSVVSNKGSIPSYGFVGEMGHLDVGVADYVVQAVVDGATSGAMPFLIVRLQGTGVGTANWRHVRVQVGYDGDESAWYAYCGASYFDAQWESDGAAAMVLPLNAVTYGLADGVPFTLRAECFGQTIKTYVNNVLANTFTDTVATGTRVGFSGAGTLDNFLVTHEVAVAPAGGGHPQNRRPKRLMVYQVGRNWYEEVRRPN